MQSICSFNIAAISSCNIMPCVNPAYGNHMEWKNPCAICEDLVDEMYAYISWGTTMIGRHYWSFVVISLIAIGFAQT